MSLAPCAGTDLAIWLTASAVPAAPNDFCFNNHGTVWLLHPLTDTARAWLEETRPIDALYFGGALAVEHRFVVEVADAIHDAGFSLR